MPRVAILFYRFGPYHHARLNAAGRRLAVWGVEACAREKIYAWDRVQGANAFVRVTLTSFATESRQWRQELRHQMHRVLDEIKPQVVAIPGWILPDALSGLAWCMNNNTPVVIMSESTAWDEPRKPLKEWIKGRLVKMCAAGLAGGTAHADYLAKLGLPRERIFWGYDIVDNDYFAARAAQIRNHAAQIRGQYRLPKKYFLASARFIGKKNLSGLLEAYAVYRAMAKESEHAGQPPEILDLVIVGDGPLRGSIQGLQNSLGLQASVHLTGFRQYEELPVFLSLATAFVHPSTTEQWGLVVNEAMACGLPVLVSNRCGCASDLVREGANGFTFDPRNVNELAGLMWKITAPQFPLSQFGSESRRIISNWAPERFAEGISQAVALALKAGPPPAHGLGRLLVNALLRFKS